MVIARLPFFSVLLLLLPLGDSSAQELYGDEVNLGQYTPLLGENFIDYPTLEEYGYPEVEEFPNEDLYEDDDQPAEGDSSDYEQIQSQGKKKTTEDNEHAPKSSTPSKSLSYSREKRQAPLQDNPVVIARGKLERAIKAAQALTGLENRLGLNPSGIENKTAKLESQLKDEEQKFRTLADQTDDGGKKNKLTKLEKAADEDISEADSIFKLVVKLEAAKYLAKERAREELEAAERNRISALPAVILGSPASFPSQGAPFVAVSQPSYAPSVSTYTTSFQPQILQGMSLPNLPSPPNTVSSVSPVRPGVMVSPYHPSNRIATAKQPINSVNAQQASVSALPPKENAKQTSEAFQPEPDKVAAYTSENEDASSAKLQETQLATPTTTGKSAGVQSTLIPLSDKAPAKSPVIDLNTAPAQASAQESFQTSNSGGPAMSSRVNQSTASQFAQQITIGNAQTTLPITGQAGSLMSSWPAPLTASSTPSVAAPDTAALPNVLDSSSNPNGSFGRMSLSQPLANSSPLQQDIFPPSQLKKIGSGSPESAKPMVSPYVNGYSNQPQMSTPNGPGAQLSSSAAFSNQQALTGIYPSNAYYYWNAQNVASNVPQRSWGIPMYYPVLTSYQPPENTLLKEAYEKLHNTEKANLAMTKIEEAIGLSPNAVRDIIDVIEKQAKNEKKGYEQELNKEKSEINKEKEIIQSNEPGVTDQAKKIIKVDEAKLRNDIRKESIAKGEVDNIKKIEKILTIIEAAKYSAMQRAKHRLKHLKGSDKADDIRKRDLQDLEKDVNKQRRSEVNISLKGLRNRIDTSHVFPTHGSRLSKLREQSERLMGESKEPKRLVHEDITSTIKSNQTTNESPGSRLQKLKLYKTFTASNKLDSGRRFGIQKITDEPKAEESVNAVVMAKMLKKMDDLLKVQGEILKYLKKDHNRKLKNFPKRWKRSLHNPKHRKKNEKISSEKRWRLLSKL